MASLFAKQGKGDRKTGQAPAWSPMPLPRKCEGISRLWRLFRRTRPQQSCGSDARRIQWTKDISRFYELRGRLQASTQPGTQVRCAARIRDKEEQVVKTRNKGGSNQPAFANARDEQCWRTSMELMLSCPPSPHLSRVHDVFEDSHCYYVAMEHVRGVDLGRALRRRSFNDWEMKIIMNQLLLALKALHESCDCCILHRDIKLENIVLDEDLSLKLVDFDDVERHAEQLGGTRWVSGTDQCIAPEAYSGEVSPASDLFAAGVVLYKLLFGRFPFRALMFDDAPGENWVGSPAMEEIRCRLAAADVDWSAGSRRPPLAISFCRKLMALDVSDRFASAREALAHPWFDPKTTRDKDEVIPAAPQQHASLPHRPSLKELEILSEVVKIRDCCSSSPGLEDPWAELPTWATVSEEQFRMTRHSTTSTMTLDESTCEEARSTSEAFR